MLQGGVLQLHLLPESRGYYFPNNVNMMMNKIHGIATDCQKSREHYFPGKGQYDE